MEAPTPQARELRLAAGPTGTRGDRGRPEASVSIEDAGAGAAEAQNNGALSWTTVGDDRSQFESGK